jgi:hypothetical protein
MFVRWWKEGYRGDGRGGMIVMIEVRENCDCCEGVIE